MDWVCRKAEMHRLCQRHDLRTAAGGGAGEMATASDSTRLKDRRRRRSAPTQFALNDAFVHRSVGSVSSQELPLGRWRSCYAPISIVFIFLFFFIFYDNTNCSTGSVAEPFVCLVERRASCKCRCLLSRIWQGAHSASQSVRRTDGRTDSRQLVVLPSAAP